MEPVIHLPVKPFLSDARAHMHMQVWRDSNEAKVKEFVKIRPQEQSVANAVGSAKCEWANMCRLKDWQGFLTRDRAPAVVRIGY